MNLRGLDEWASDWWKAAAEREGFMYRGRPSVRGLLLAIAKGEYRIVKNGSDKSN